MEEKMDLFGYSCFQIRYYRDILVMLFAASEINENSDLLPNLTLALRISDSCMSETRALEGILLMLAGKEELVPNYQCQPQATPFGFVGGIASSVSIAMSNLLDVYRIPQVSYAAQHDVLSDKMQFPSFLRTVPPMGPQSKALAMAVKHFGWTWIGIVYSDYDVNYMAMKVMREDVEMMGICVSFWEKILDTYTKEKMRSIAERIKRSSARVLICDCFEMDFKPLLQELNDLNVIDKIWICSTALTITPGYFPRPSLRILNGSLVMVLHSPEMPKFKTFLERLHPSMYLEDIFIHSFWEIAFDCKWTSNASSLLPAPREFEVEKLQCTGTEVLNDLESMFVLSDISYTYHTYLSVHAMAQSLQDLMLCTHGMGPFLNGSCADVEHLKPWQMLHYVRNVHFSTSSGEDIFFDQNGDVPAVFDFVNIQISPDGAVKLVKVGTCDSTAPDVNQIKMKSGEMLWSTGSSQSRDEDERLLGPESAPMVKWVLDALAGIMFPSSFCSESCLPGFRQSPRTGQPNCCFDCTPCSAGEISNMTDAIDCWPCPEDHWPNEGQTQCDSTTVQFLSLEEPLGIALSCLTCFFLTGNVFVLCIFKRYQDTPIIKANNRELSYVLLITLMLCFLSSFTFIGHPVRATCMIRQNMFGIIFAISISTILAKTITVIIAFNARDPTSHSSRWLGTRMPVGVVLLCSFPPVLTCTVWLLLDPPFPVKIQIQDTTIIQCDEGSVLFFYLMLGYLGLLATVSFVVAFHARNLPQSFNEAKFLTFSMLVFLAVWISFIPAYLSTEGKYLVAVEIFAILSSAAGLLGCIFFPKCYILLWRPDMNTKQYLMQTTSVSKNK
ncbi:extracellular calcium-sensing receptor-like [Lissotriton helveticus]